MEKILRRPEVARALGVTARMVDLLIGGKVIPEYLDRRHGRYCLPEDIDAFIGTVVVTCDCGNRMKQIHVSLNLRRLILDYKCYACFKKRRITKPMRLPRRKSAIKPALRALRRLAVSPSEPQFEKLEPENVLPPADGLAISSGSPWSGVVNNAVTTSPPPVPDTVDKVKVAANPVPDIISDIETPFVLVFENHARPFRRVPSQMNAAKMNRDLCRELGVTSLQGPVRRFKKEGGEWIYSGKWMFPGARFISHYDAD